jgi:hypothetical protein
MSRKFNYAVVASALSALLLFTSCMASIQPLPEEKPGAALETDRTADLTEVPHQPAIVNTPAPPQESLPTERQDPLLLPEGLTLEEYKLTQAPSSAQIHFTPTQGSSIGILVRRYSERHDRFPDNSFMDSSGRRGFRAVLGEDILEAQRICEAGSNCLINLSSNNEEIYQIDTGRGGGFDPLIGLWVYDDHWVLETTLITPEGPIGRISQNAELLYERYGYEEMFGFQLIAGRPFYFFQQEGKIGFSFDNQVVEASYEEVPHYVCCGLAQINPISARNMVAFFAEREGTWYYVELGVYE